MNCLSWILGHVAAQEQYLWLEHGLGAAIEADLCKRVGFRQPANTPDWQGMWELWHTITSAADKFLATIPQERLDDVFVHENPRIVESVGISLLRNIYHCWHHQGEAYAMRQLLRHSDLPVFVGSMDGVRVK
jgi:hypothetical protein